MTKLIHTPLAALKLFKPIRGALEQSCISFIPDNPAYHTRQKSPQWPPFQPDVVPIAKTHPESSRRHLFKLPAKRK